MAKQSITTAPARPRSTSAAAPTSDNLDLLSAVVKPMLADHQRVQRAAAARRKSASPPLTAAGDGAPELSPPAQPWDEADFYPAHELAHDSPQYAKVHERLCITLDLPCLVCGVRNSTLADPAENRYGAQQLETHHHVIEWALAGVVDVARFNKTIRPHLRMRQKDQPIYQRDMSAPEIRDWVEHSEDNLWVLCDIHHRHKELGIHDATYPLWGPQDLLRADFTESPAALSPTAPAGQKTTANRITAKLKVTPSDRPK